MLAGALAKRLIGLLSAQAAWRGPAAMLTDAALVVACWHAGYLFRMGWERWQPARPEYDDEVMATIVVLEIGCLWALRLYRMPWRFFGFAEMTRIAGTFAAVGAVAAAVVILAGLAGVARSVLILHPVFCILALCLPRMGARLLWEEAQRIVARSPEVRKAVVLSAASPQATAQAVARMTPSQGWALLGYFSPSPAAEAAPSGMEYLGGYESLRHHKALAQAAYVIVVRTTGIPGPQDPLHDTALTAAYATGKTVLVVDSTPGSA